MCNSPIRERKRAASQNIQITEIRKWYWNNAMTINENKKNCNFCNFPYFD